MQLHEVDEIQELFDTGEVNEALATGWRIVAVVSSVQPRGDLPVACYVLGRYVKKDRALPTATDIARANGLG
ncbi:hypothetical protein RA263_26090 [Pseudomonas syringae pv. tagetis]|uniref:Uncharacterized protein n=1 Tax=Pseudomonas syringae pv. tagetis TaxID=129140 RepID=A0A0N8T1X0_9PSED|nr:hypothetical protein [Pseudomonas syringae group genomosp. 7]KPY81168.1 hypothetical protein ALO44_200095 [Pseudomonas syringae pv. tagetis]RMW10159.1 hypothetical protein ALO98_200010 [Pseudomonas syringae pv. tagetis]RMW20019.1 hypothetical protein ALO97_200192 [Pseudomonas syringae pv. tagetis]UNB71487.1 hypothetical protein MME58_27190 [Pseudomonas syringae pv. tagetis]